MHSLFNICCWGLASHRSLLSVNEDDEGRAKHSYERHNGNRSEQGPQVPSHRSLLSVNEDDEGRAKHSYERFQTSSLAFEWISDSGILSKLP